MAEQQLTIHPLDGTAPRVITRLDPDQGSFVCPVAWVPTVAGGRPLTIHDVVPLGEPDTLIAIDGRTGLTVWRTQLPGEAAVTDTLSGSSLSTGEHGLVAVIVGRSVDPDQVIAALDAATGELRWTAPVRGPIHLDASITPIIVRTAEQNVALDPADGSTVWTAPLAGIWDWAPASDLLVGTQTYPGEVTVRSLSDGHELWRSTVPGATAIGNLTIAGETLVVTPMPDGPGLPSADIELIALQLRTGAERWRRTPFFAASSVDGDDEIVIAVGRHTVQPGSTTVVAALSTATGDVVWERELPAWQVDRVYLRDAIEIMSDDSLITLARADGSVLSEVPWAGGPLPSKIGDVTIRNYPFETLRGESPDGALLWEIEMPLPIEEFVIFDDIVIMVDQ